MERVFGVPGESYLAALDAFHDAERAIEFVICRQEGGAAYMAEAYGKLTGKPGICFVTRGPGATNASVGVHTAFQDSTPMLLFISQVAREQTEREAFREIDYRRMFGQMAKWVVEIEDDARIPELVSQAFHRARQWPAGTRRHRAAGGHVDQSRDGRRYTRLQARRDLCRSAATR
ncbi:Acetolactate synthase large subunit (plasmid) [Sinorhizobium sp. CCBAU 05631]|nr:Acetolactate synthase large subunit [Sinorhizobium sp. CCBAU 05631]